MLKKILSLLFLILSSLYVSSQEVQIDLNLSSSNNSLIGQSLYHVSESIYTQTEIGASNFISEPINQVAFSFTQIGNPTQVGSYRIWMKNISNTITTFSSGTYSTSGYTLVYNGSITPNAGTWFTINLQNSFARTSNSNLQVLVERLDGIQHVAFTGFTNGFIASTSNGNNNSVSAFSSRRYNGTSLPGVATSLTVTPFRPAIRLIHKSQVDLSPMSVSFPTISCFSVPQSISVKVSNSGNGTMLAGQGTLQYRSGGANSNSINVNITSSIASGDSALINLTGIIMNNVGVTFDTIIVSNTSDQNRLNDTMISSHITAGNITQFPFTENFENNSGEFGYFSTVSGNRNLWTKQNGGYTNPDQVDVLSPRSAGNSFLLFDSYGGSNSSGFISRVFGSCITIPATNSAFPTREVKMTFWMSHDPSAAFVYDSIYVVVSEDKGQNWTRVGGFQRWDELLDLPEWRKDSVNLSSYTGKTIQIGFEGVSKYGNAMGLDDIEFSVTPFCSNPPISFAGQNRSICNESVYSISAGNPSIGGSATSGYWVSSGTGNFTAGNGFATATTYSPSMADKQSGSVVLSLITNNPDSLNCLADTSQFTITILPASNSIVSQEACDSLRWNGNTYFISGTYSWLGVNQQGCDSNVVLNLTIKNSTIHYDTVVSCTPYVWNGNTYSTSGTYTYQTTNSKGCDSVAVLQLSYIPCVTNLTVHALLEGYYRGTDSMATPLYDLGMSVLPNMTDSIVLMLWRNTGNLSPLHVFHTVINRNGVIQVELPDSLRGKSFYIGLRHRNHMETWSSGLVSISYNTNYSFKNDLGKALSDGINPGMRQMGINQFALYSGDVNQDGTIDLFDLQETENDASSFTFGYEQTDVNGDTTTDLFDLQTIENNSTLFIFSTRPF